MDNTGTHTIIVASRTIFRLLSRKVSVAHECAGWEMKDRFGHLILKL